MDWTRILTNVAGELIAPTTAAYALAAIGLNVHFGLTGLLNRTGFFRLAHEQLARHDGEESQVIMADLDHFKLINDVHGHRAGDAVLALASSGLHSNGYSLVRHILTRAGIGYGDRADDFAGARRLR